MIPTAVNQIIEDILEMPISSHVDQFFKIDLLRNRNKSIEALIEICINHTMKELSSNFENANDVLATQIIGHSGKLRVELSKHNIII